MPFSLRQLPDLLHEPERLPEILELETSFDAAPVVCQLPLGHLGLQALSLSFGQRRDATLAGRAGLLNERFNHCRSSCFGYLLSPIANRTMHRSLRRHALVRELLERLLVLGRDATAPCRAARSAPW